MNPEKIVYIRMRSTNSTPPELRRLYDGQVYPWDDHGWIPAAGTPGTLYGVPGVMGSDEVGPVWWITKPHPPMLDPGPPWAGELARELAEIKDMLKRLGGLP